MTRRMRAAAAALVFLAATACGAGLELQLIVAEPAGIARTAEPVSGGIPMPAGLVRDLKALRLLDAEGAEVPAQFSAINRWGQDQSVAWLLVQSVATLPANGNTFFTLKSGIPSVRRPVALKVEDGTAAVTVDTGRIRFTVSKQRFNLIDQAWVTANGRLEQIIASDPAGGSAITLANDEVYTSTAAPPTQVVVEEAGPERATILVRGLHRAGNGSGVLPYLYGYMARIRAYADQPYVRISYSLTGGHEPAIGSPLCKGAVINVPLKLAGKITATLGGREYVSGELAAGTPAVLVCRAPRPKAGDQPSDPNDREVAVMGIDCADAGILGDPGWAAAGNGTLAASLAVRYLRENHPVALGVVPGANGAMLQLQPWPRQDFLDICSVKTYEMQLTLASGDLAARGAALHGSFHGALRFWCPPAWVNRTDAWSDFGRVAVLDEADAANFKRRFRPYGLTGWRDHGSTPEFESGSSRAPGGGYEPLLKTAAIYLGYLQYNDRRHFDQLERTSWHWRDRRLIYLDGDWSAKSWAGRGGVYYAHYKRGEKDFPTLQPPAYRSYDGAWNYSGRYGPMDTQHFSVDEVVNYYYLTGDRQCLDALEAYGKQAASFVNGFIKAGRAKLGRDHGWVTRALMGVYEATNDRRWFDMAQAAVRGICDNQDKLAGCISDVNEKDKDGMPVKHTPFMNAAVGMALGRYYRHHPEEEVRDAILGIADWLCYDVAVGPNPGFSYNWTTAEPGGRSPSGNRCMSTMAWAFLATGQQRYLEAADKHAGRMTEWLQNGFGQEYVYIKTTPRPDATLPAAVTDLTAAAMGGGRVRLTWTAPADPGNQRAAEYQVKHAAKEIRERADWRTRADSEISFWAASNCQGEPTPAAAGTRESFTVAGLAPGTRWFALKSYDRQPNQSDLSNVVAVEVQ